MKKLFYALALMALISTMGCHKDTATANTNVEQLVIGKWRNNTTLSVYAIAGKEVDRISANAATNPPDEYIEFRANNVYADFVLSGNSYTETDGTYSISNNYTTLHITVKGQSIDLPFNYQDNSNISVSTSLSGKITYVKDNVIYTADNATITTYLVRM